MDQKFKHWESLIFWALIFIHLIPLWSVSYFPTQDGPVHLENAVILSEYSNPEAGILREYYIINNQDLSNWLVQLFLSTLVLISPLLIAEKILISGYIILFPISVRYCLKSANPDSTYFAFFAFPFVYNYTLHMGFFGFCYSLVMFFFLLGFWLKHRDQFTTLRIIILSGLSLLTYLLHIVSLVMAYTAIGILIILFYLYTLHPDKRNNKRTGITIQIFTLLMAFLPTLLLMLAFLSRHGFDIQYASTFTDRLIQLAALTSLFSYIRTELWVTGIIVIILFLLSMSLLIKKVRDKQHDIYDMLLIVFAVYLGIYFLAPDKIADGEVINARLMLYCYFILIIWLGTQIFSKPLKQIILWISSFISLFILGLNLNTYARINTHIKEFATPMKLIQANSTLLPLSFYETQSSNLQSLPTYRVNPFMHAASLIPANKRIVGLGNYQAWKGYFPIQYRKHLNPMNHLAINNLLEAVPPAVDIASYIHKNGGRVDYVLLWALEEEHLDHPRIRSLTRQLKEGYSLIYESPQPGHLKLYRSNKYNPYKNTINNLTIIEE